MMPIIVRTAYLSEPFCFGMLLKAKSREVYSGAENPRFGQYAYTSYAVNFHFHVGVSKWISKVGQMRSPSRIFSITLYDHRIFVYTVR